MRSAERRPDPEPVPTDERAFMKFALAGWALALVLMVIFHQRLADSGRSWWFWTPVVAIALGLYGFRWLTRQGR